MRDWMILLLPRARFPSEDPARVGWQRSFLNERSATAARHSPPRTDQATGSETEKQIRSALPESASRVGSHVRSIVPMVRDPVLQASQQMKQRRFSRTGRPSDRDALTCVRCKRYPTQDLDAARRSAPAKLFRRSRQRFAQFDHDVRRRRLDRFAMFQPAIAAARWIDRRNHAKQKSDQRRQQISAGLV